MTTYCKRFLSEKAEGNMVAVSGIAAALLLAMLVFQQYGPGIGALSGSSLYRSISCAAGNCSAPVDATAAIAGPNGIETAIDIDGDGVVDVVAIDIDGDGRPDAFRPLDGNGYDSLEISEVDILDEFDNIIGRNTLINGIPIDDLALTPDNVADILRLNGLDPSTATLDQIAALIDRFDGATVNRLDNGLITSIDLDTDGDGTTDRSISAENLLQLLAANGIDPRGLTLTAAGELAALTNDARAILGPDGSIIGYAIDLDGNGTVDATVAPANVVDFLSANGLDPALANDYDALVALAEQYTIPGLQFETNENGNTVAATIDMDGDGVVDGTVGNPDFFQTTGSGLMWQPDNVYDYGDYLAEYGFSSDLERVLDAEEWRKNLTFIDENEDGIIDFVGVDLNGDGEPDFINPAQGNGFDFRDGGVLYVDTDGDGEADRTFTNFINPDQLADELRDGYSFKDAKWLNRDFEFAWDYGLNLGEEGKDVQLFTPARDGDGFADYAPINDETLNAGARELISSNPQYAYYNDRLDLLKAVGADVDRQIANMSDEELATVAARMGVGNARGEYDYNEKRPRFVYADDLRERARQQLLVETVMANLSPEEIAQLGLGTDGNPLRYLSGTRNEGKVNVYSNLSPENGLRRTLYELARYFGSANDSDIEQYRTVAKAVNGGYVDPSYADALARCNASDKGCYGSAASRLTNGTNNDLLGRINKEGGITAIEQAIASDLALGPTDKDRGGFFSRLWQVAKPIIGIALDVWSGGWAGSVFRAATGLIEGQSIGQVALGVATDFALQGLGDLTGGIQNGFLSTAVNEVGREAISVLSDGEFSLANVALGIAGNELGNVATSQLGVNSALGGSIGRNIVNTAAGRQSLGDGLVNVGFNALGNELGNAATRDRRNALQEALDSGAITQDEFNAQSGELGKLNGAVNGAVNAGAGLVNGNLTFEQFSTTVLGNGLGYALVDGGYDDEDILTRTTASSANIPTDNSLSETPTLVSTRNFTIASAELLDDSRPISIYVADRFDDLDSGTAIRARALILPRNVSPSLVARLSDPNAITDSQLQTIRTIFATPGSVAKALQYQPRFGEVDQYDFAISVLSSTVRDWADSPDTAQAYQTVRELLQVYDANTIQEGAGNPEDYFYTNLSPETLSEIATGLGQARFDSAILDINRQQIENEILMSQSRLETLNVELEILRDNIAWEEESQARRDSIRNAQETTALLQAHNANLLAQANEIQRRTALAVSVYERVIDADGSPEDAAAAMNTIRNGGSVEDAQAVLQQRFEAQTPNELYLAVLNQTGSTELARTIYDARKDGATVNEAFEATEQYILTSQLPDYGTIEPYSGPPLALQRALGNTRDYIVERSVIGIDALNDARNGALDILADINDALTFDTPHAEGFWGAQSINNQRRPDIIDEEGNRADGLTILQVAGATAVDAAGFVGGRPLVLAETAQTGIEITAGVDNISNGNLVEGSSQIAFSLLNVASNSPRVQAALESPETRIVVPRDFDSPDPTNLTSRTTLGDVVVRNPDGDGFVAIGQAEIGITRDGVPTTRTGGDIDNPSTLNSPSGNGTSRITSLNRGNGGSGDGTGGAGTGASSAGERGGPLRVLQPNERPGAIVPYDSSSNSSAIVPNTADGGAALTRQNFDDPDVIDVEFTSTPDPLALEGTPPPTAALPFGSSRGYKLSAGPLSALVGTDPATGRPFANFECRGECGFDIAKGGFYTNLTNPLRWVPNLSETTLTSQPVPGLDYGAQVRLEGLGFEFENGWSRNGGATDSYKTPLDGVEVDPNNPAPPSNPTGDVGPPPGLGRFLNSRLQGSAFSSYTITPPPWMSQAAFKRWVQNYTEILQSSPNRIPDSGPQPLPDVSNPAQLPSGQQAPLSLPEAPAPDINRLDDSGGTDPGSICSFSAETLVTTASGLVPIASIRQGTHVLAMHETKLTLGFYPVRAVFSSIDLELLDLTVNGQTITTTPNHRFYSDGEWIAAGDLEVGSFVTGTDLAPEIVEAIEPISRTERMYNMTVDDAHTYFVGEEGLLVHNANCNIVGSRLNEVRDDLRDRGYSAPTSETSDIPAPVGSGLPDLRVDSSGVVRNATTDAIVNQPLDAATQQRLRETGAYITFTDQVGRLRVRRQAGAGANGWPQLQVNEAGDVAYATNTPRVNLTTEDPLLRSVRVENTIVNQPIDLGQPVPGSGNLNYESPSTVGREIPFGTATANTVYQRGGASNEAYEYVTDGFGRLEQVNFDNLELGTGTRTSEQVFIGRAGEALDEGGHMLGNQFLGSQDIGIVPQDWRINRGPDSEWAAMERQWAEAIGAEQRVEGQIILDYSVNNSIRPDRIRVDYLIDGVPFTRYFDNNSATGVVIPNE